MLSHARFFPTATCQVFHSAFQASISRVQTASGSTLPCRHALCTAFPRTAMNTPTPSPGAQLRPPGRLVATHAGLTQQEYWQALEEFAAQDDKVWHERLRKAGIQPLTKAQQYARWVSILKVLDTFCNWNHSVSQWLRRCCHLRMRPAWLSWMVNYYTGSAFPDVASQPSTVMGAYHPSSPHGLSASPWRQFVHLALVTACPWDGLHYYWPGQANDAIRAG